jgi:endoglucanase
MLVNRNPNIAAMGYLIASFILLGCSKQSFYFADNDGTRNNQSKFDIGASSTVSMDHHILVDQFGYRPSDPKVAVIRNPQIGFDSKNHFSPGKDYQVRNADTGKVVFSGMPSEWNNGQTQQSSGDNGWWFDFGTVSRPGRYFIYDVDRNVRSATFLIDPDVYKNILKASMRTYFYQRSAFAKRTPYADSCWIDSAAYIGTGQDREAVDITDPNNQAKKRDLSGGWFDAGDTNKYVTFAVQPVHQLLTAYQENPAAFTDDFNIPESGNGVPDVLDEVKWEIDWLKKMQYENGSSALKVGETTYTSASPPSSDKAARYYVPNCTSSTISIASMFAHASYTFAAIPSLLPEATALKERAIRAWNNYQSIPDKQLDCDTGVIHAGDADLSLEEQNAIAAEAAIYLYAISGEPKYDSYIREHYREMKPYRDMGWSRYNADQGEALLFYTTLAHANNELKAIIIADKLSDVVSGNQIYKFNPSDDLYRAFLHDTQYHWGSNNPRANYGNTNLDVIKYGVTSLNQESYLTRALEIVHYYHGVNPLGMVYLTNMYSYGATDSANEIYHTWFQPKTKWSNALSSQCGPPPGFVPGGPNLSAEKNGVPRILSPPNGQPAQKSYKDWNKGTPDSSWAVTEPGIYFQSAYVQLLSAFVH